MSTNEEPTQDNLPGLLRAVEADAAPVDRAFLDQLRERSSAAFQSASERQLHSLRPRFFAFQRALAASVTLAAAMVVGLYAWLNPSDQGGKTLADTFALGKIVEVQGVVGLKPTAQQRWSPAVSGIMLHVGDWLRTDVRGPNAARIQLGKEGQVILGPGTVVEILGDNRVQIVLGEMEVVPGKGATIEVVGGAGERHAIAQRRFVAAEKEKLAIGDASPRWLESFKQNSPAESMGSLIAKVDGRDVPLTVGYHKVTIEVRDQIARTTIEESFVNRTDGRLEGVFHFPLPQDASISGFGMWIGNDLVEADIVEKQRAREIYEEILRQRKDPGLLEWTGGSIFKARVFPIEPRSEKRIKISYTQVLPLRGHKYRYSYALQSEMLKQFPLRELSIDFKIHSAVPLAKVACPTHPTRASATSHSAHLEFTAQEYVPTRDFEVVVETAAKTGDVVMIPHRRGTDGYFMLQLLSPGGDGAWDREVIPDGEPLHVLILADTSASMDAGQRAAQAEFVAAMLGSLTPRDTVNLAMLDVNVDWVFPAPVPAEPKDVQTIRDALARRRSLGWTDLDKAFASLKDQAKTPAHVIYVGDGVITTGEADPAAFAQRLQKAMSETRESALRITGHAVAVGSTIEPTALKAIARIGGGSYRKITSEQGPRAVALELLSEIARPTLRNVQVEFRGLRVARVYPSVLPNVPAGTQQIILGRYLPDGEDQIGEVIVTGAWDGKPVRFSSPVSLKDAEHGNSFIPRLWARMHLDALLEQGQSAAIRDEIIALSEEYQIMTPYTSFLVLESDAQREEFKVKRQVRMRDGEKFFREGTDQANYQLVQQQMRRAGAWRTNLQQLVRKELATLGRDAGYDRTRGRRLWRLGVGLQEPGLGGAADHLYFSESGLESADHLAGAYARPAGRWSTLGEDVLTRRGVEEFDADPTGSFAVGQAVRSFNQIGSRTALPGLATPGGDFGHEASSSQEELFRRRLEPTRARLEVLPDFEDASRSLDRGEIATYYDQLWEVRLNLNEVAVTPHSAPGGGLGGLGGGLGGFGYGGFAAGRLLASGYDDYRPRVLLLNVFPVLLPPDRAEPEPRSAWPAEAAKLARSLLRQEKLAQLPGGVRITRQTDSLDPRTKQLTARGEAIELAAARQWLTKSFGVGSETLIHWCDGKERGVFCTSTHLGQVRPARSSDLQRPPLELGDFSITSLEDQHPGDGWKFTLEPQGVEQTLLTVRREEDDERETRYLIDTRRQAMLRREQRYLGKTQWSAQFDDFVEVAGCWWARRIETRNEKEQIIGVTTQTIALATAEELAKAMTDELAARSQGWFLRHPLPQLPQVKKAFATGQATLTDVLLLAQHFANSQQWEKSRRLVERASKLSASRNAGGGDGDSPALSWLGYRLLHLARQHEELRIRVLAEADRLAGKTPAGDDLFLAERLVSEVGETSAPGEMLALLDRLKPVYDRQPGYSQARKTWQLHRLEHVAASRPQAEVLELHKHLAETYPDDLHLQQQYARALGNAGFYREAYAWIDRTLANPPVPWDDDEEHVLRELYVELLRRQGKFAELLAFAEAWVGRNPVQSSPYGHYLDALVFTEKETKADEVVAQWLKDGMLDGKASPSVAARLDVAIQQVLGRRDPRYADRSGLVENQWLKPLADVALFYARHPTHARFADAIMQHDRFASTGEGLRVRLAARAWLTNELDQLTPAQITRFMEWMNDDRVRPTAETWLAIAQGLRQRWNAESRPWVKDALGGNLRHVLRQYVGLTQLHDFMRLECDEGPERYRPGYRLAYFQEMLAEPWTQVKEDQAFTMLPQLGIPGAASVRLATQVAALNRLSDSLLQGRANHEINAIKDFRQLPPKAQAEKRAEATRHARLAVAERLANFTGGAGGLAPWVAINRAYFLALAEKDLDQVVEASWRFLGDKPVLRPELDPYDAARAQVIERILETELERRHVALLAGLAIRKDADPQLVQRLLKYFHAGAAGEEDATWWKQWSYQLLVALDKPRDLEEALQGWVRGQDPDNRWRIALGYVLAEQGQVAEAIRLFEAVEMDDELSPRDYETLARWYQVVDRKEKHEEALAQSFATMGENFIHQELYRRLQPWQRSGQLPNELDGEVLLLFRAAFQKSTDPQNLVDTLHDFYRSTRDFRLLAALAEGIVGHSAGEVYAVLQGLRPVLNDVHDEAAVDQLAARIVEVRAKAASPVDRRALDLLEALVHRRGAELKNQPGPHGAAALAALKRAFDHAWTDGEQPLMADLLRGLGRINEPELAMEQLRQIEALLRQQREGSLARLRVADALASLWSEYGRQREALDLIEVELKAVLATHGGVLPQDAMPAADTFVMLQRGAGRYAAAERFALDRLEKPLNDQQARQLRTWLYAGYHAALAAGGRTSLGEGAELFRAVLARLARDLATFDHEDRHQCIADLCRLHVIARSQRIPGTDVSLRQFAFVDFPPILKRQTNHYESCVRTVGETVHELLGPTEAIRFLLARMAEEPAWLAYQGRDAWSLHANALARWRAEAAALGDVEQPLLDAVLKELRRDLETENQRNRGMYWRPDHYFWSAKADAFAKVAEEVFASVAKDGFAAHPRPAHATHYLADYVHHGLGRTDRAIEMLFLCHNAGKLDDGGITQLVGYLHEKGRHGESIALLQPLVERHPDQLGYRIQLMRALHQSKRNEEMLALLAATEQRWKEKKLWHEGAVAQLGSITLENRQFDRSVNLYAEAIRLRLERSGRRGVNDGTLSHYYSQQARAYLGLKKLPEAVDAASAAIVCWGPTQEQRRAAIDNLRDILRDADDLDGYVNYLDELGKEKGLDSPIVRKALGQAFVAKNENAKAIAQFRLAIALQPNDAEIHQQLLACLDRAGDKAGAIDQLLEFAALNRRDADLWKDLGNRLLATNQPAEAERAYTSIVEMLAQEAEGHAALAEVRQEQDRWPEAITHWRRAAQLRSLEPTYLIKLARAQLSHKQFGEAAETIKQLTSRSWPPRFDEEMKQVPELRRAVESHTPPGR